MTDIHPNLTAGAHDAHPDYPHQFDDVEQKNACDTLGMWAFLATEVLFFGGLFAGLMIYRSLYTKAFVAASNHLYQSIGAINTAVLLVSSFTVVLSVRRAAKAGDNKRLTHWLLATMALGATFLIIKGFEYHADYRENLIPLHDWPNFGLNPEAAEKFDKIKQVDLVVTPEKWAQALNDSGWKDINPDRAHLSETRMLMRHAQLFYVFYYTMTMIHALHMIIGLVIFGILAYRAHTGYYRPTRCAQIEITGLYWHFVDIVWIFLFPLLYLVR